ncbi:MAG TPA: V-type ATPase subunit [Steroidobacteraceae bacterium]
MTIELLRELGTDGYPTDYLLARIRARRAVLATQWAALRARGLPAGATDDLIWEGFLRELGWLRTQMNRRLRADFAPVFGLFELKTLVLCLRHKAALQEVALEQLLAPSQLSAALRRALLREPDVAAAVGAVAEALSPAGDGQVALQRAYADAGLKGFEVRLNRHYLESMAGARLHPLIRDFLATFVDVRNLMTLYKHLRWGIVDAAAFTPGGTVPASVLRQAAAAKDAASLDRLVRGIAGRAAPPLATAEGSLETILLGSLTRKVRGFGRDDGAAGTVLDYAWRVYIHARNRSILLHAADLGPATLEKELVA